MGRKLGAKERYSEKKVAACRRAVLSRWADPVERAKLDEAKAVLREGLNKATPRLVEMLVNPDTPPGLFIELYKMIAPKVGMSDRVEQAVSGMENMAPMIVVVGGDEQ